MEFLLKIHLERLPEGMYLATSEDLPGLVAQGWTASETLEIARDVARKLLEARQERRGSSQLDAVADYAECVIVVGG